MNKIISILIALLLSINLIAQTPHKISYQSVIRDATGKLVDNKPISVRISILQNSANGTSVYTETQTPTSNANGRNW
jgi:hypothetical protein